MNGIQDKVKLEFVQNVNQHTGTKRKRIITPEQRQRRLEYGKCYRIKNKEILREKNKQYLEDNRDKEKERHKLYSSKNKEKKRQYQYNWRVNNRDKSRRKSRVDYAKHPKRKEYALAWKKKNRDKATEAENRRRAIKLSVICERINPIFIFERDQWICGICGKPVDKNLKRPHPMSKSLDHIVPLSKKGNHTYDNLQLAHLVCNIKMSNKDKKRRNL